MKRLDVVQLTIIIVGLLIGYQLLTFIPQFLYLFISWFGEGLKGGYYLESFILSILQMAFYLIAVIYFIRKSKHFAEWICHKASLNGAVNFALNKTELLFVLFTGIGVYGLIKNLPALLVNVFYKIKSGNSLMAATAFEQGKSVSIADIFIQLFMVLLFFILVYYGNVFAEALSKKINNTEPDDAITDKTED